LFAPSLGDTFQIITSGGNINGTFATELLPALAGGLFLDVAYTENKVLLLTVGLLGDYNLNGVVEAADYTVWRNSLGQAGAGLAADGNASGTIDAGDFDVWKMHFGATSPGSGSGSVDQGAASTQATSTQVPEPTGFALAFGALVSLALALASRTRISDT